MEMENLKLVKLAGGIGNQMFQYTFGEYLRQTFHAHVKFFNECNQPAHSSPLSDIGCHIDFCSDEELHAAGYHFTSHKCYRIRRKLLLEFPWLCRRIVVENGSQFHAALSAQQQVFDGYWQSYRYLSGMNASVRGLFDLSAYAELPVVNEIVHSESVFVHIRRGDYLQGTNARIFEACPLSYFEQGMDLIKQRVSNPVFYIFSNDIEWVREHLRTNRLTCVFVDNDEPHTDLKDLACMSRCRHAIISNSTFSWWGAWLAQHQDQIVIAPRNWYKDAGMNMATEDLIPPAWTRI